MDNFVILLLVGLGAGVMSGMFGIGGGIVIVPALTLLLAFTAKSAVATSLAALLLPVGIFAVIAYQRKGLLDIRASAILALGLVATTLIGARITLGLPDTLFKQAYGVFVIVMGLRFLGVFARKKALTPNPSPSGRGGTDARDADTPQMLSGETLTLDPAFLGEVNSGTAGIQDIASVPAERQPAWPALLAIGLFAGVLSGMFGIGGGIVIVPALIAFFGLEQKRAVGTSLGALLLPVGLPGVLEYYAAGELVLSAAVPVAIGLAVGALGGARLAIGLSADTMRRLYGVFLLIVGAWFIIEPLL